MTKEPLTQGWKPSDEAAVGELKAVCGILGPPTPPRPPELPIIPERWELRFSPSMGDERLEDGGVLEVATSASDQIRGFSLWLCSSFVAL